MRTLITTAILLLLISATHALAQDGVDLSSAVYHGSPNVSRWPVTVVLQGVEFKSGRESDGNTVGVRPIFDRAAMNSRWPDVKPVGWDGFIQYTFWACVRPSTVWHCAGLHEFWSDRNGAPRIWTGAPILTQWSDWVYRNQWGPEMETYRPQVGDEMAFLLTSGDRRLMDLGDVRERTNAVRVKVVAAGIPENLGGSPQPEPTPVPSPTPQPIPPPVDLADVYRQLEALKGYIAASVGSVSEGLSRLSETVSQHASVIDSLSARVVVLESRPVIRACRASLSGIIPISCRLE
jgi:hypothetical protein